MRVIAAVCAVVMLSACGSAPSGVGDKPKTAGKVKITQFYAPANKLPKGMQGQICYGVENAKRVQLDPPVEEVWPAVTRCFSVSPVKDTTYTLTAYAEDGSTDRKTVRIQSAAAPPRLYDLWVNKIDVQKGEEVRLCFKVENVTQVKVSAGTLNPEKNCLTDRPSKTTTYKITALGGDREMDSGTVTVKVH